MSEPIDRIRGALSDPDAPWYGSDLVPMVTDLCDECERLKQELSENPTVIQMLEAVTEVLCLLDIAKAGEKLNTAAQKIHDEIYPRTIFVGCDDCCNETCDCCRGVQISRQLADGLDAFARASVKER